MFQNYSSWYFYELPNFSSLFLEFLNILSFCCSVEICDIFLNFSLRSAILNSFSLPIYIYISLASAIFIWWTFGSLP